MNGLSKPASQSTSSMGVSVCCSYADLGVARDLVAVLGHRGLAADVVADVDRDDDALVIQLVGDPGPTIYVLLASETFAPERVQVLVTLFGAHRQSTHRLQIVEVDEDEVESMATTIEDAVKESAKRAIRTAMERVSSPGERAPSRGADAAESKPRPGRTPREEDPNPLRDRVGAIPSRIQTFGTRAGSRPATPTPPMNLPSAAAASANVPSELVRPPSWPTAAALRGAEGIDAVERLVPLEDDALVESAREGASPAERSLNIAPEELFPSESAGVADEESEPLPPAAEPGSSSRIGLYAGAAIAIAAAVAVVLLLSGDSPPPSSLAASIAPGASASPAKSPDEPGQRPAAKTDEPALKAVAPASAAKADGPPPPPDNEEPPPAPKTPPEPEPSPVPVAAASDAELSRQIAAALDTKRIRAIDNLLVFRSREHADVEFGEAARLCRIATVNRIRGWRLPSIVELRKLRSARMMPRKGWFWSRSAGKVEDGQAGRWILTRRSHRPRAVLRDELAQTVCIRER